ncbi:putative Zn-dependent protease [Hymenobacter luteus]|uniref:Zn-dependent protease n=2 Tax=Hymenobacter TaxID=89966 RepID=A0ABR6JZ46_9BACT|nr:MULTISPECIES: M48 family metalloprotease [Hymenobacter]MBB4602067.1 putative Zn-dependent protease [Hymenobacter latericoloratus]MBB6059504.1 putative Zn-dependent protease [Hymenobacter luteus]
MRRFLLKPWLLLGLIVSLGTASSCSKDGDGVLLFSVEDDIALGQKVAAETDSTFRAKGQLLEPGSNPTAYAALGRIVTRVLDSGKLQYRNEFPWDVKIIRDDQVQNAFATPGGHIYVYSGLIKYLDNETELAGVLGHEIAHADRRHTSRQLQSQYGISVLLSLLLGENENTLVDVAASLGQLKFSRDYETEADSYSVEYLNGTNYYACDGAAGFFIKAEKEGQAATPEFLSTHPNPGSRIQNIQTKAEQMGCRNRTANSNDFNTLKNAL